MLERLKRHYDGYHFSSDLSINVYNPFSLICAMSKLRLDDFWFATGTPNFLVEVIKHCDYALDRFVTEQKTAEDLDAIDTMFSDPIPLFFQSGYLTIKDYDARLEAYQLGFHNCSLPPRSILFMAMTYTLPSVLSPTKTIYNRMVYKMLVKNPNISEHSFS